VGVVGCDNQRKKRGSRSNRLKPGDVIWKPGSEGEKWESGLFYELLPGKINRFLVFRCRERGNSYTKPPCESSSSEEWVF